MEGFFMLSILAAEICSSQHLSGSGFNGTEFRYTFPAGKSFLESNQYFSFGIWFQRNGVPLYHFPGKNFLRV